MAQVRILLLIVNMNVFDIFYIQPETDQFDDMVTESVIRYVILTTTMWCS